MIGSLGVVVGKSSNAVSGNETMIVPYEHAIIGMVVLCIVGIIFLTLIHMVYSTE